MFLATALWCTLLVSWEPVVRITHRQKIVNATDMGYSRSATMESNMPVDTFLSAFGVDEDEKRLLDSI